MNIDDQNKAVSEAVAAALVEYGAEFALWGFPGKIFRISERNSYYGAEGVMLYTDVKKGDDWLDFAKATPAELRDQVRLAA